MKPRSNLPLHRSSEGATATATIRLSNEAYGPRILHQRLEDVAAPLFSASLTLPLFLRSHENRMAFCVWYISSDVLDRATRSLGSRSRLPSGDTHTRLCDNLVDMPRVTTAVPEIFLPCHGAIALVVGGPKSPELLK